MAAKNSPFETTTCGRCGGTGHYSYNQINGTTCFGCGGTGLVFTPRGAAASAEFRRLTTVAARHVRPGWFVFTDIIVGGRPKWRAVEDVRQDAANPGHLWIDVKGLTMGMGEDSDVRAIPNDAGRVDALAKALEYQAAWTPPAKAKRGTRAAP